MTRPRNRRAAPFIGQVRDGAQGRGLVESGPTVPPMCWPCKNSTCPRCLAWLDVLIARKKAAK